MLNSFTINVTTKIMKKLMILFLAIISASISFSQEKSVVNIYRPGQLIAAGVNFTIYVNGEAKCKLSNNKRIVFELEPGKIEVIARQSGVGELMKKVISFDLELEAGQEYFIKGDVKSSVTRYRMELSRVFPEQFNQDVESKEIGLDNCQIEN